MRSSQSTSSESFVDPSSLSLPSPPSEADSPQPSVIDPSLIPSSSSSPSVPGPPRKRARTDATPEERREARAHRNRIAAQNSRDRRKLQFSELEDKVRALQQENDRLRAQLQLERERRDGAEKDKENAELKQRVKSLEQGWEAVLKALQTQGLPSSLFANPPKEETSSSTNDPTAAPTSTTTFPVFINNPPVILPPSPLSTSSPSVLPSSIFESNHEPTRHLARVATAALGAASLQRTNGTAPAQDTGIPKDEDTRIEDWFNEVLASHDSPVGDDTISNTTSSALGGFSSFSPEEKTFTTKDMMSFDFTPGSLGESGEDVEMDRLLNLLPASKDDIQVMLGSVIDERTSSGTVTEGCLSWELAPSSAVVV